MSVTVLYFASLRDAAGVASEQVSRPHSLRELYEQLRARHGFSLEASRVRVAVDGETMHVAPPIDYRIRPGALRVIAPPA